MGSGASSQVANGSANRNSALGAFWQILTRVDKNKINTGIAVRNSLAVAIPLGVGIALGHPLAAVAIASGALNVSYSDGHDPYAHRARRMLAWSALGALAAFIGSITGPVSWLAVLAAAVWAFIAGLAISVSTRAGDLGLNTLVTCVVYGARGASSPAGAAAAGALVLAGGLLQMLFAVLLWPVRRHSPERQAVGKIFSDLAHELSTSPYEDRSWLPIAAAPSTQVQDTLAALGRDGSVESARFRMLFDQAERVRLSTFRLQRLRTDRIEEDREPAAVASSHLAQSLVCQTLELCPHILSDAAKFLLSNKTSEKDPDCIAALDSILAKLHEGPGSDEIPPDIATAIDTLGGQLRTVLDLAENTVTTGPTKFEQTQAQYSWRLQVGNWLGTLRANLDWRSSIFRHAVRLASCVLIGDGLGRIVSWQRTYWIPMTIAVVLKPDFATTISRGLLRLGGTFAGLILATLLYHAIPTSALTELTLVGVFTLLLRSVGPANYGVFTTAVSGLIVFLIAVTGISPKEVVAERAVNTALGGVFALIAYFAWPTWERKNVGEVMAQLIDATRSYFEGIERAFQQGGVSVESMLDEERASWRRARVDAETSLDRLGTEPRIPYAQVEILTSMLASSRAVMATLLSLEAGLLHFATPKPPPEFQRFAHDIETTLYFLSSALRGSDAAFEALPQLRQDHTKLLKVKDKFAPHDQFVITETDRLTVALNTLREQVFRFVDLTRNRPKSA